MIGRLATLARSASCCSCNWAAGRWVSSDASSTFFFSRCVSRNAILPDVVVLPEPCSPTIRIGTGAAACRFSGTAPAPPSASIITSLTTLMTCWPGATLSSTSIVVACSRTLAMKSFTTGSATSASSSARRTSRSASAMSISDKRPRLRSPSKTPFSLLDSESNIEPPSTRRRRRLDPVRAAAR